MGSINYDYVAGAGDWNCKKTLQSTRRKRGTTKDTKNTKKKAGWVAPDERRAFFMILYDDLQLLGLELAIKLFVTFVLLVVNFFLLRVLSGSVVNYSILQYKISSPQVPGSADLLLGG